MIHPELIRDWAIPIDPASFAVGFVTCFVCVVVLVCFAGRQIQ